MRRFLINIGIVIYLTIIGFIASEITVTEINPFSLQWFASMFFFVSVANFHSGLLNWFKKIGNNIGNEIYKFKQ